MSEFSSDGPELSKLRQALLRMVSHEQRSLDALLAKKSQSRSGASAKASALSSLSSAELESVAPLCRRLQEEALLQTLMLIREATSNSNNGELELSQSIIAAIRVRLVQLTSWPCS